MSDNTSSSASSASPFVDPTTGDLETAQILSEAIPLGKLIGVFVAISLVPFALAFSDVGNSGVDVVLVVIGQFVLAVGAGIVLMYAIARGLQLSEE